MAKVENHFSISVAIALLYAAFGVVILELKPESIFLASVILVIAGILPNIDEGKGLPAKEFNGFIAAISPLVLLQLYPKLQSAGMSRLAIVVICSYIAARYLMDKIFTSFISHRGMMHSIPAAIITFEIIFLIFRDTPMESRLYISVAALIGFLSHLVIDGYTNLDLVNRAMGKGTSKQAPVLKLWNENSSATFATYACMFTLGWLVLRDLYPNFKLFAWG
ncbi:MAG: metal-dependent hydrolase [Proteobacteria bacterium]|nr:metal-dependent hydrolase [Pseudomonadota bacterium]